MRRRLCFIDDDGSFELPLFAAVFGKAFDLVVATSLAEARGRMRAGWRPDLFVLDLYFPSGRPNARALGALKAAPLRLESDRAELRRAHANALAARARLEAVLAARGQGPAGGIALGKAVARAFPEVPVVFYSRKATTEDALRCLRVRNEVDVIQKPSGRTDAETRSLTEAAGAGLAARFRAAIRAGTRAPLAAEVERLRRRVTFLRSALD